MALNSKSLTSYARRWLPRGAFALGFLLSEPASASLGDYPVMMTAGASHTCAVMAQGSVRCAGDNSQGQLGDGTTTNRLSSVVVAGLSGVVQADAGGEHSCAVTDAGIVKCWGSNDFGQLGDGTWTDRLKPVSVVGLGGKAVQVTAGGGFTCALLADGSLRCWGNNQSGKLGDGTTTNRNKPVVPLGFGAVPQKRAISVSAGNYHACAVNRWSVPLSYSVVCWGDNGEGQLGDGTTSRRTEPVPVKGLSNPTSVSVGWAHACARQFDGKLKCWGYNASGQLGDGTTTRRLSAVTVKNLTNVSAVSAGGNTCAVDLDDAVWCWGNDFSGQAGNGSASSAFVLTPGRAYVGSEPLDSDGAVSVGNNHVCSGQDASVCWGGNSKGQLGDGTTTDRSAGVYFKYGG